MYAKPCVPCCRYSTPTPRQTIGLLRSLPRIEGAEERLVPILMTASVTALGLAPIAVGLHAPGQEIQGPMAVSVLGGLITSTLLNLIAGLDTADQGTIAIDGVALDTLDEDARTLLRRDRMVQPRWRASLMRPRKLRPAAAAMSAMNSPSPS